MTWDFFTLSQNDRQEIYVARPLNYTYIKTFSRVRKQHSAYPLVNSGIRSCLSLVKFYRQDKPKVFCNAWRPDKHKISSFYAKKSLCETFKLGNTVTFQHGLWQHHTDGLFHHLLYWYITHSILHNVKRLPPSPKSLTIQCLYRMILPHKHPAGIDRN